MTDASKKASKCIDNVAQSGQLSAKAVTDIVTSINETSEAVNKISEMVTFITDIASQTNLLSLNASIEAARAGESGRSFSVVASEIGKLAQESSSSAENIRNIVSTITKLSNKCVDQAAAVNKIINEQQILLENALSQFDTLSKEITNSVENIDGVAIITETLG